MKTRHCDECRHVRFRTQEDGRITIACTKGHRPKFFSPRFEGDTIWGWKRKCPDFSENALNAQIGPGETWVDWVTPLVE